MLRSFYEIVPSYSLQLVQQTPQFSAILPGTSQPQILNRIEDGKKFYPEFVQPRSMCEQPSSLMQNDSTSEILELKSQIKGLQEKVNELTKGKATKSNNGRNAARRSAQKERKSHINHNNNSNRTTQNQTQNTEPPKNGNKPNERATNGYPSRGRGNISRRNRPNRHQKNAYKLNAEAEPYYPQQRESNLPELNMAKLTFRPMINPNQLPLQFSYRQQ